MGIYIKGLDPDPTEISGEADGSAGQSPDMLGCIRRTGSMTDAEPHPDRASDAHIGPMRHDLHYGACHAANTPAAWRGSDASANPVAAG